MNFERITYATADRIARITLNRPEKRNALDDLMIRELTTAAAAAGRDTNAKVLMVQAAGPAFSAGADLEQLSRIASFDLEENRQDSARLAHLFRLIYEMRKPTIAVVNGPALAGGCGLASVCDFVIASREHARFGYTEVQIGFIPAIVMVFLCKRIGEGRARALVLRGNIIGADEAHRLGLVTHVAEGALLQQEAESLARELITKNSGTAMGLCKEMLSKLQGMNLPEALDFAANMNAAARMTPDCRNGVRSFLNKEPHSW